MHYYPYSHTPRVLVEHGVGPDPDPRLLEGPVTSPLGTVYLHESQCVPLAPSSLSSLPSPHSPLRPCSPATAHHRQCPEQVILCHTNTPLHISLVSKVLPPCFPNSTAVKLSYLSGELLDIKGKLPSAERGRLSQLRRFKILVSKLHH